MRTSGDISVLERVVYTMTNRVTAGLVARGKSWPGLRACWPTKRRAVERPGLFRTRGPSPAEVPLQLHRPPGFSHIDDVELGLLLRDEIEAREAK